LIFPFAIAGHTTSKRGSLRPKSACILDAASPFETEECSPQRFEPRGRVDVAFDIN
jgi:hypothetical protein